MSGRLAIVPVGAAEDYADAERHAVAVFDALDSDSGLRTVRGNASLVRTLLRELQHAILPHRCEEATITGADGVERHGHVMFGTEDTPRMRILGCLGHGGKLHVGRDSFAVVWSLDHLAG